MYGVHIIPSSVFYDVLYAVSIDFFISARDNVVF